MQIMLNNESTTAAKVSHDKRKSFGVINQKMTKWRFLSIQVQLKKRQTLNILDPFDLQIAKRKTK